MTGLIVPAELAGLTDLAGLPGAVVRPPARSRAIVDLADSAAADGADVLTVLWMSSITRGVAAGSIVVASGLLDPSAPKGRGIEVRDLDASDGPWPGAPRVVVAPTVGDRRPTPHECETSRRTGAQVVGDVELERALLRVGVVPLVVGLVDRCLPYGEEEPERRRLELGALLAAMLAHR